MNLRPATHDLAEAMAVAHAQAFDTAWDKAAFEEVLAAPEVFGLVALDSAAAGLVVCRAVAGEGEVLTIAVTPPVRRRGIARALMTAALDRMRGARVREVFLEVDAGNFAAIELYESLGFGRVGLRKGYYDRGAVGRADALLMRLDLEAKDL